MRTCNTPHATACRCRAKKQYCGTTALGAIVRGIEYEVEIARGKGGGGGKAHNPNHTYSKAE